MENYLTDGTLYAEQFNSLLIVNDIIKREKLDHIPVFELVGGTAILFHGIIAVFTVDIDCVNSLNKRVKELTDMFISDMASEVALLPSNYKSRLINFEADKFDSISVRLLSLEDLVITKLAAFRAKDKEDLTTLSLLDKCDLNKLQDIICLEIPSNKCNELLSRLSWSINNRELIRCREEANY